MFFSFQLHTDSLMATVVSDRIVMPGDVVLSLVEASEDKVRIGPGLRRQGDSLVASKAGILRTKKNQNVYWVDSNQRRVTSSFFCVFCRLDL